jgi:hypothetical protein
MIGFCLICTPAYLVAGSSNKSITTDRIEIFNKPFLHLKEELEKTFFRDDLISSWIQDITGKYPSILYMLVTDSDNRLIEEHFNNTIKDVGAKIKRGFLDVDKLFMEEETFVKTEGNLKMLVSRNRIVIEMDTYSFETGFGPIK